MGNLEQLIILAAVFMVGWVVGRVTAHRQHSKADSAAPYKLERPDSDA